jgi:hypothetical protein
MHLEPTTAAVIDPSGSGPHQPQPVKRPLRGDVMRFFLAIQCFFRVLFDRRFADGLKKLTHAEPDVSPTESLPRTATTPSPSQRSDAIALLATLQREARFVDLVNESLEQYSDAQVGAATREVLTDCGKVLNRLFALKAVVDIAEGESLEVPSDYDTGRFRLKGDVSGQPPLTGKLMHAGWIATQCELPSWTGSSEAALVVAPAEVQVD